MNRTTAGFSATLLAALALAAAPAAHAQIGASTEIITGRVVGPDSTPVAGARVEVTSFETQVTRSRVTDQEGHYTILFPDGGGSYSVQVSAIGFAPVTFTVLRLGDEDRLVADARLGRPATVLSAVEVRAAQRRGPPVFQRPEPGSTERGFPPFIVNRLPVEAGDLNALAALAPGVIGFPGTDSTAASVSIGGQADNQNALTLDGLTFGSGSVPQEAVRGTRVITNTYDVSRGQFTGGQIATTTRSGTNLFQGTFNYSLRDPSFEVQSDSVSALSQSYSQNQVSGGLGGPLVRNRVFAFGAASYTRRSDALRSLLIADPLALLRLGTSPDSVQRFLGLLNLYGLSPTEALIPDERLNNTLSSLARMDANLGESHTLMLRGDLRRSTQDASRISPFSVPHSGGNARSLGGGGMLTLTSQFSSWINELRAYVSAESRNSDPYVEIPSGRVIVASDLGDGTGGISTLQFGANSALPQQSRSRLLELSDEISRLSRGAAHRVKLGGLVNEERTSSATFANMLGTYTFNSLADFEAGSPAQFTRTLASRNRDTRTINGAVYLGDSWRQSARFQVTYGVRIEGSVYPDEPAYNPAVDSAFQRRTDLFPSEVHLSPRIGFSYTFASDRASFGSIRGGIGEFRGRAPGQLFAAAGDATGRTSSQSQLVCVGEAVPEPDWALFRTNPSSVPVTCHGPGEQFGSRRPNVTVFDESFGAPRVWRASLGINKRLGEQLGLSIDGSAAMGLAQPAVSDLNLDTAPKFRLAAEADRPVFVPAGLIVPLAGTAALAGSRVDRRFGIVSQISSHLRSSTQQLSATVNAGIPGGRSLSTSYTYTRSKAQTQGFSSSGGRSLAGPGAGGGLGIGGTGGGTTSGDPNLAEWSVSDFERRHAFVGILVFPMFAGLELTAIGSLASGGFFTPIVSEDINGDGLRNDRSFIFDPGAGSDTALANGMSRLLASAPERARECLVAQMGSIAGQNTCSVPWSTSLDLRANFRPAFLGLNRRLTLSVVALNALTGLDQLLHGRDNLHGWGQPVFPDRTLLYLRGFDPVSQRYVYQVNERFGAAVGTRGAFRVPLQFALQGRLAIGADPVRQQLTAVFGGRTPTAAELRRRLARTVPNPFREILAVSDSLSLQLTEDQERRLESAGDTFQIQADSLMDSLAEIMSRGAASPDARIGMRVRERVDRARTLAQEAVDQAQAILTAEQWQRLPVALTETFRRLDQERPGFRRPGQAQENRPPR